MTHTLHHHKEPDEDIFIRSIKKAILYIRKYPYHTLIILLTVVALIFFISTLFQKNRSKLTPYDYVHNAMSAISSIPYQQDPTPLFQSMNQSLEEMKKEQNDSNFVALVNLIEGFSGMISMQYDLSGQKFYTVASGEIYAPKFLKFIAHIAFADMINTYQAASLLFSEMPQYVQEDSALTLLAFLDAGENFALTVIANDSIVEADSVFESYYQLGKSSLDFSYQVFNNHYFKQEAYLYRNLLEAAYQARKNKISLN
ncbi:MAG: hypothetical protein APR63_08135 [Desulfuromonas sp. SDB]|nr:MAG: hypothetical protein APR63_08135 [Desulfuromonas sp. SDB]